jgi:hypothetical protein
VLWAYSTAAGAAGVWPVRAVGLLLVAGGLGWPVSRRLVARRFAHARVRRRFLAGARRVRLVTADDLVPFVGRVRDVPAGERLSLRLPPGCTAGRVTDAAEALAVCLRVREVRVQRCEDDASRTELTVVRRDPLAGAVALPWPWAEAKRVSLWQPVPVGVDENGEPVTVELAERNVLFGGEPGAGKSAAQSQLVAAAALDPDTDLYLIDGKQVELAPWVRCGAGSVGPDVEAANALLAELQVEMDARYAVLLGEGRRKVTPADSTRLVVVVVDELAFYTTGAADRAGKQARAEFAERLRDLVARGRAAGIVVLAATQKPSADVVPTFLRDLFGFRWALRCSTPQASDTILGQGWASAGYSATDVPGTARGVGYLLAEGGRPVRLKSHYLDDAAVAEIAERAAQLRRGRGGPARPAEAA